MMFSCLSDVVVVGTALRLLFALLLITRATNLAAQSDDIAFEHLTLNQGLSSNTVTCILQDSRGFMWFGTDDGLCRYDGYVFTTFHRDDPSRGGLSYDEIRCLFEDNSGVLWVGTSAGLNKYDPIEEKFTNFFPTIGDSTTLSDQTVRTIGQDNAEVLWVGTGNGLNRFQSATGTFVHLMSDSSNPNSLSWNGVSVIYQDKTGTLWIGAGDYRSPAGGLNRYDPAMRTFTHYVHDKRNPLSLGNDWVTAIFEDRYGNIWIGTDGGLDRLDRATGTFSHFQHDPTDSTTISSDYVKCIDEDEMGNLLVGTWGGGLNRLDKKTGSFEQYTRTLARSNVVSLCRDRSGVLWVGTSSSGVFAISNLGVHSSLLAAGIRHLQELKACVEGLGVTSICQDRSGTFWFGSTNGAHAFNQASASHSSYFADSNNGTHYVHPILEDRSGNLWVGTEAGLHVLDRATTKSSRYTHNPQDPRSLRGIYVTSIVEDSIGTIWMGTFGDGLYRYDKRSGTYDRFSLNSPDSTLPVDIVYKILLGSNEELWLGTNKGLGRFSTHNRTFTWFVPHPNDPRSIADRFVQVLYQDRSEVLWIGLGVGLDRLDEGSGTFTHFTTNDGLRDPRISAIIEDHHGNLWISTWKGISKFNRRTHRFRNYGSEYGFGDRFFNSSFRDSTGNLYFGRADGLTVFHPDSVYIDMRVPPIVLTGFSIFDQPAHFDSSITVKRHIELTHHQNVFGIDFSALGYVDRRNIQYAYMLEGFDTSWVFCGSRHHASYMNLNGGSYVFRVKCSNYDGQWNDAGVSIAITIIPPFWATWWFRTFAFVTMLASVGGTIRYVEMKKLKRKIEQLENERALERERTRISQDMHDEVGASLTEIAILSELARKEMGDKSDTAGSHIRKIADRSREVVDSISEIIWTINPKNDHLNDLVAYLHQYAVQFLKATAIRCRFESSTTVPDFSLSAEVRRHIFLVVKEALHNVVKHSDATDTTVRCGFGERTMEVSVEDNGKGFPLEQISRFGNGVLNMRKRIENIGGTFIIDSHPGGGTKVCITVPIAVSTV